MMYRIYFSDSADGIDIIDVDNFWTEGGLLRLHRSTGKDLWYPLCKIFKISEV